MTSLEGKKAQRLPPYEGGKMPALRALPEIAQGGDDPPAVFESKVQEGGTSLQTPWIILK